MEVAVDGGQVVQIVLIALIIQFHHHELHMCMRMLLIRLTLGQLLGGLFRRFKACRVIDFDWGLTALFVDTSAIPVIFDS